MSRFYSTLRSALTTPNGATLGELFDPTSETHARAFALSNNHAQIRSTVTRELPSAPHLTPRALATLIDVTVAFWEVTYTLERGEMGRLPTASGETLGYWGRAYDAQRTLTNLICRGFTASGWPSWLLPILYTTLRTLRSFAIATDAESAKRTAPNETLEDAARHLNKAFTLCLSDRAPLEESRKWGTYVIMNLLFKTYFKLNAIALSKNLIRALTASCTDMPPLDAFPKSQVVTYYYYVGVTSFLDEDYPAAETALGKSLRLCPPTAARNVQQILTYLVPTHLITTHQLPAKSLLAAHPQLERLFAGICAAVRQGNLRAFEEALQKNEAEYVSRRIYLTLERARDITLRNLFRRVYLIREKATRITVDEFRAAMGFSMAGREGGMRKEVEPEECECLIAGLVYKGLMKGYVSREKGMVVLSGRAAFPGTGV